MQNYNGEMRGYCYFLTFFKKIFWKFYLQANAPSTKIKEAQGDD